MFLFFCKQKTAYEMRISDWSSDVCSSDLVGAAALDGEVGCTGGVPGVDRLVAVAVGPQDRRPRSGLQGRTRPLELHRLLVAPAPAIPIAGRSQGIMGAKRDKIRAASGESGVLGLKDQVAVDDVDDDAATALAEHALPEDAGANRV